jgi:LmbE family N-acetylglucosaminyl deacetylase
VPPPRGLVAEVDIALRVDRTRQQRAIAEHRSQSVANPVLWRRLELLGNAEWLRWLRPPRRHGAHPHRSGIEEAESYA